MSTLVHNLVSARQSSNQRFGGDFPLDDAVIQSKCSDMKIQERSTLSVLELPEGTKILSADSYGFSAWTVTARISTILADGSEKHFFLKVSILSQYNSAPYLPSVCY
jgi:protein-ribulosamine 3-kinase